MSDIDQLLKTLPVGDIARQVGVDEDTAQDALQQILPGLVGGLQANVADGGEASLEKALGFHQGRSLSLADVDEADGQKIVKNVFGDNAAPVASKLADSSAKSSVTQGLIEKILPIVAPLVLAWLANRFFGQKDAGGSASAAPASTGGGLGDILGGLLGGGSGSSGGSSSGGGIGDILGGLGGLLGGGKR
ncbi:hypothetical protein GCM10027515_19640 [Schumannella luteola]|uniref:DUF937 domain-containing protein n=1 Tax=Schumannella luteola TaxID=472059 RepID=A0A852YG36_9MICO|nr:DUF937 domain-containing protein [Schumannella luteola]NYH00241.1 hypothetical protein [Schumannella luteola]TPX04014.1 DUF937 domain-containing protein [Schumannella luteola]